LAKLHFSNQSAQPVGLVIEPWAQYDLIPPDGVVEFEFNDLPPPVLQFSVQEDGRALVYVNSERVTVRINGEERSLGIGRRAPPLPTGMLW
jgi:hypothetical protein